MNIQDKTTQSVAEAVKKVIENKKDFKPHMMYDPKTGKGYEAKTYEDHLKMKDMGYTHEKPSDKEEGNAFGQAVTDAKKAGKKKFKFQGKDYKVEGDEVNEIEIDPATNKLVGAGTKKESVEISEDVTDFRGFKSKDKLVKFTSMAKKLKIKPVGNPIIMKRMGTEYHVQGFSGKVRDIENSIKVAVEIEKGAIESKINELDIDPATNKLVGAGAPKNESVEEVEITEATAYSEIEKVFTWAKKYMRASKGKNYPDVTVNTKFKDSIYVFLNLSIYNIMAISLGGKKGILVKHDTRKMEKGSDFKRKEHEFSSAKDVIKFAKKEYDSMPKDESVEESANLEEAIMLQHFGFVGSANLEEAYDSDEKHTMDPKSHVELNKETGMYCVYNIKGKKVAEFKTKEEAEEYAVKNHDSLMKESVDLEEALKPADFVKGGDAKVTKREVDGMLSKIFINTKLAKSVEASKAFKAGEKDAGKKKNPYKSDTADFHLYELGSQSASM